MNLEKAKLFIINAIKNIYDEREASNIAQLLLEWLTGKNKIAQYLDKYGALTLSQENRLIAAIERLNHFEPIQYLIGEAWFMGLSFKVNPSTLIPRPETEELIEWILNDYKNLTTAPINLLDIGTGSGCIPILLKQKIPASTIHTIDISNGAIECAKQNAVNHGSDINCIEMDFTNETNWAQLPSFNIIVSNPPYIMEMEKVDLHKNVLEHEPASALFVPNNNPLLFYKKIKQFSTTHLQSNGQIYLEINEQFGSDIVTLFTAKNHTVELKKDMQGKDRMVKVIKK